MIRNLIYLAVPLTRGRNAWQDNLARLSERQELFNGRRIVTVVQGKGFDPIDRVERRLPANSEIRTVENHKLRETPHFAAMLREIRSVSPGEISFFAHTKGISKNTNTVSWWRNRMYHHCLSRVDEVDAALSGKFHCAGCFKRRRWSQWHDRPKTPVPPWHYSGTFFWFRHDALFSLPSWGDITQHTHGAEAYLGQHIAIERAYCLFGDKAFEKKSPYSLWRKQHWKRLDQAWEKSRK